MNGVGLWYGGCKQNQNKNGRCFDSFNTSCSIVVQSPTDLQLHRFLLTGLAGRSASNSRAANEGGTVVLTCVATAASPSLKLPDALLQHPFCNL